MTTKPFRFGVVAAAQGGAAQWRETARRAEDLGYSILLSPDNLHLPTPTAALAVAAAVTDTLRVGSFVLASPLRTPRAAAWEAHSLSVVTDRRFELGIGTGIPAMREAAAELGLPYGTGAERLAQVADTITHLRTLDGAEHTPVLLAAGGPRARRLGGERADIVTLADKPLTSRADFAAHAAEIRAAAGDREVELAMNVFVVGDEAPPWIRSFIGADAATLREHDSLAILPGDPAAAADELERRRAEYGVSYVSVNGAFLTEFAPIVARLSGQ
ncbi:alkanesulfonate monooxygenase SsuD/methylene tetrahydromethanopterin reductase-like flavin-dependent oxidoreductase (luciferase family) [Amycolatopsis sulphurea]|uniref:Alkanesulfonate monooxygenase SsuD/methylene tetrahydromethanopterin reductase-like flavin-dependent oxidoreductase (Luciferase family) n=1 Tax=Amycolatopsis sulphurea TaxID=76022 RepID=A0A2A9G1R0_9PSEU|nr:LLM class flavin-dependent oxidoreductase [Amycolatopsis sulphurea]PFG56886.1 alkanesulfonate monooxygenase SsuD/methylene tetrahydromethanopterin reductase-like flavin-dependent oxidoreductase (luciferase family) [Amycolatopsis sulphurea]